MVWLYHSCLPITDLLKDFWADSSCYEHLYRFLCEHKVLFFWDKFPDNAIAVSYDICTFILKKKKSVFQSFWALTFPSAMYEWSSFSTSLAAFGVTLFLIYFSPSDVKWHLTVILICVSLRVNDVEHIFMCLFAICISSSVKRFCLSSVHFIMFACFSTVAFLRVLYIVLVLILCQICDFWIYSLHLQFVFSFFWAFMRKSF